MTPRLIGSAPSQVLYTLLLNQNYKTSSSSTETGGVETGGVEIGRAKIGEPGLRDYRRVSNPVVMPLAN